MAALGVLRFLTVYPKNMGTAYRLRFIESGKPRTGWSMVGPPKLKWPETSWVGQTQTHGERSDLAIIPHTPASRISGVRYDGERESTVEMGFTPIASSSMFPLLVRPMVAGRTLLVHHSPSPGRRPSGEHVSAGRMESSVPGSHCAHRPPRVLPPIGPPPHKSIHQLRNLGIRYMSLLAVLTSSNPTGEFRVVLTFNRKSLD